MTNNEIIRDYEICNTNYYCTGCTLEFAGFGCCTTLSKKVLGLIKHQQAEIDRLNSLCTSKDVIINSQEAEIEHWKEEANNYQNLWCETVKDIQTVKAEAIKEFADRLFRKSQLLASSVYGTPERGVFMKDIDALTEKGGEQE